MVEKRNCFSLRKKTKNIFTVAEIKVFFPPLYLMGGKSIKEVGVGVSSRELSEGGEELL